MDIKKKDNKSAINNQSSVIKISNNKRKFFGFFLGSKSPIGLLEPKNEPKNIFKTKKRKIIFSLLLVLPVIVPLSFYLWNKNARAI